MLQVILAFCLNFHTFHLMLPFAFRWNRSFCGFLLLTTDHLVLIHLSCVAYFCGEMQLLCAVLWPFIMSEASKSLLASTDHGQLGPIGPDYFGFYTREIMELLSQDEDPLPSTSRTSELTRKKCGGVRGKDTIDTSGRGTVSSFSNSIGAGFTDFKKERLRSLLRQGVFGLAPEVDEVY